MTNMKLGTEDVEELMSDLQDLLDKFTQIRQVLPEAKMVAAPGTIEATVLARLPFEATVLQLLCEKWGRSPAQAAVEQAERENKPLEVVMNRTPRAKAQASARNALDNLGLMGGEDNDGLSDPLPSQRVMGRQIIDELDKDGVMFHLFRAGVRWVMARMVDEGLGVVAEYGVRPSEVRAGFEKYWLGR